MVTRFMIYCPGHSMTRPPPSSTHTCTESSTQVHVLLVRMGLHGPARRLPLFQHRHRDLVDQHHHQRQSPTEHLGMYDGHLRVTTRVEVYRPSTGLYHHPSKSQTLTLSCSRSSVISRVRRQVPCTRRESQSFINSSKHTRTRSQK